MSATTTINPVLEIRRLFDAPPHIVFDAWLEREQWQAWIGPEGCQCEVPLLEPKVGGRYRIQMRLSDGREIPVEGVFKIIDRPNALAFTWGWAPSVRIPAKSTAKAVMRIISTPTPNRRGTLAT